MNPPAPPSRLDRWSGACWIAAGLLLLLGTLHPDIFETTLAHVAADALWVPIHVAALVAVVLTLFGPALWTGATGMLAAGPRRPRLAAGVRDE